MAGAVYARLGQVAVRHDRPSRKDDQRTVRDDQRTSGTVRQNGRDEKAPSGTVPDERTTTPAPSATDRTDRPADPTPGQAGSPGDAAPAQRSDPAGPPDIRTVAHLIPAARAARVAVATKGRSLSRDNLADAMRNDGHGVSNGRASLLLKILKAEQEVSAIGPAPDQHRPGDLESVSEVVAWPAARQG